MTGSGVDLRWDILGEVVEARTPTGEAFLHWLHSDGPTAMKIKLGREGAGRFWESLAEYCDRKRDASTRHRWSVTVEAFAQNGSGASGGA